MKPPLFPRRTLVRATALSLLLVSGGCARDLETLAPAEFPTDATVFSDGYAGVNFAAFQGSKVDAVSVDPSIRFRGQAAIKVVVPAPGDAGGGYAGGAFVAFVPRNLTGYNALTFYAKAAANASLDVAGLGNDNSGSSRFTAQVGGLPLTTSWKKYVIPIPLAARLAQERGAFFFAEGPENGSGNTLWFDEIQFENVSSISNPRPSIGTVTLLDEVGANVQIAGTSVTYRIGDADQVVSAAPGYFTFVSSNEAVAKVSAAGAIQLVGTGAATVTATLGGTTAAGALSVRATAPPTAAAPTPTRPAAEVIALFSDAYPNRTIDTWSASWDQADVADVAVGGNAAKKYTKLAFAGIEFLTNKIDASQMTHLHLDAWIQDPSAFRVKLVNFGANGVFGGGDDSEHEVALSATTTPGLVTGAWNSLDIPMTAFAGLTARAHLAQIVISGASQTVYLDNVYFYKVPAPTVPTVAAPTPNAAAGSVISLFSNAYPNRTVNTWSADWDQADVADVVIAGNDVKRYSSVVFAGIEFTSAPIDAATMTTFHMDIWTPDATDLPKSFRIKLVDFGANGTFDGGDDSEHEFTINASSTPPLRTGAWVSISIPLSAFTGLRERSHLAQMILVGDLRTVFVDNVYLSSSTPLTSPVNAAPAPVFAAADVISLFSNSYTNRTVDTWSASWDQADVADLQIAGNAVKKYTNVVFAGVEFTSQTIDASTMTHFAFDLWTPDPTDAPKSFRVKLVDFGADGAFGGNDDREHEVTLSRASTPSLISRDWVRYDLPLSSFTGLTTRGHLAQMILVGDLPTFFIDNVLLHK